MKAKKRLIFLGIILIISSMHKCIFNPQIQFTDLPTPNLFTANIQNPSIKTILDAKKIGSDQIAFLSSSKIPFYRVDFSEIDTLLHITLINLDLNELVVQNSWNVKLSGIISPLPSTSFLFFLAKIIDLMDEFLIFLSYKSSKNENDSPSDTGTEYKSQLVVINPNPEGDILKLNLIFDTDCRIYALEGVKNPLDHLIYFILIKCPQGK